MMNSSKIFKFAAKAIGGLLVASSLLSVSAQAKVVPVYRMCGRAVADNFYTTDFAEAQRALICYNYLGIDFYASDVQDATFNVPVYRLWNGIDHMLSTSPTDGINLGYKYELVAFYVSSNQYANNKMTPLYKFFNGIDHFYSTNMNLGYRFGYIGDGSLGGVQVTQ